MKCKGCNGYDEVYIAGYCCQCAEKQFGQLQADLKRYGKHDLSCESFQQDRNTMGMGLTNRKCNCGFEEAQKGGE